MEFKPPAFRLKYNEDTHEQVQGAHGSVHEAGAISPEGARLGHEIDDFLVLQLYLVDVLTLSHTSPSSTLDVFGRETLVS